MSQHANTGQIVLLQEEVSALLEHFKDSDYLPSLHDGLWAESRHTSAETVREETMQDPLFLLACRLEGIQPKVWLTNVLKDWPTK